MVVRSIYIIPIAHVIGNTFKTTKSNERTNAYYKKKCRDIYLRFLMPLSENALITGTFDAPGR